MFVQTHNESFQKCCITGGSWPHIFLCLQNFSILPHLLGDQSSPKIDHSGTCQFIFPTYILKNI